MKSIISSRNLDRKRLFNVFTVDEDAGISQLIEEEIEFLMITTPSIAHLYDEYIGKDISSDFFKQQLSKKLESQSMSKLLGEKVFD